MNEYRCAKCGESWFSAKGPAEIYCPDKCLICGGDLLYAGPAGAGDDEKKGGAALVEEMEAYAAEPEVSGGGKDCKVMYCPLRAIAFAAFVPHEESFPDYKCWKEKCHWWVTKEDKCAITEAAVSLGAIWSAIYNMFLEKARW